MSPPASNSDYEEGEIGYDNYSRRSKRVEREDDPFAEYERLSRSKNYPSSDKSYHRHDRRSTSPRHHDKKRYTYESKSSSSSYNEHRGNNNNRHSRSPTSRKRDERSKSATTIKDESHAPVKKEAPIIEQESTPLIDIDIKDEEEQQKEEDRLIEERRKRRQAILDKYKETTSSPTTPQVAAPIVSSSPLPLAKSEDNVENDIVMEKEHAPLNSESPNHVSAADYDPSFDQIKDLRHSEKNDLLKSKDNQEPEGLDSQADMMASDYTEKLEQPVIDMFSDNLDMFADTDITAGQNALLTNVNAAAVNPSLIDNWDDPEGYYSTRIGETLDDRYKVLANLGRGVFSSVVKAKDQETNEEVAIKVIRNNETMYKAGQKELTYLKKLMEADPDNKKHVIRLHRHFEHRNHLCLVFETLSLNLRDVIKKYGKDVGISIKAVRVYAQQLFTALSLLKKCGILHADIKPDNILVSESRNTLKLCDLGSASDASDNSITPYLVSRFYRAPEIMLGLHYDHAIDIWSAGCTLYELYTGKILFPGRSNNQMLKHIMELKGRFPNKMLRKAQFASHHFNEDYNFISSEIDRATKNEIVKKMVITKPTRDVKSRVLAASNPSIPDDENRMVLSFIDFLEKCFILSPDKRLTPKDALAHTFITNKY